MLHLRDVFDLSDLLEEFLGILTLAADQASFKGLFDNEGFPKEE